LSDEIWEVVEGSHLYQPEVEENTTTVPAKYLHTDNVHHWEQLGVAAVREKQNESLNEPSKGWEGHTRSTYSDGKP
jgi:hypothetical protein